MIVLDTNVISELMRGDRADDRVVQWLDRQRETPVVTVLSRAEILAGIALLPAGGRRDELLYRAEAAFSQLGVCLPFTFECASRYAEVVARWRTIGRPGSVMDALIASVVIEAGATLATRDTGDFEGLGLDVADPWR